VTKLSDHKAFKLGEAKLESSGLTMEDAEILKIHCLSGDQVQKLNETFKPLCALKIDYLDHLGKPLVDRPGSKPFFRLRYLEEPVLAFGAKPEKALRYVQVPRTAPVAYYPQNADWGPIAEDPDEPIILTEGELKAAKATKEGFPTIGLGGVYNWKSDRQGIPWIESLDPVMWHTRNVYICFDSDIRTKPGVAIALIDLAEELVSRGAIPHLIILPELPGLDGKSGLDDYLVHADGDPVAQFAALLHEAIPLGLARPLIDLNKRYVFVKNPGMVVNATQMNKISTASFRDGIEATSSFRMASLNNKGDVVYKKVPAAAEWLKWPMRNEADGIVYAPGSPLYTNGNLNIWTGWACKPQKGDPAPFLKLIDHLFTDAEPEAKTWFLRWLAYPLQHPGTKLLTSCVVHGIKQGTGKSFVGYTMQRIYGKNFTEISQLDLHNTFNDWAEGKQFVMGDDVTGSDKRADADFLKKLITQKEMRVNAKYIPSYVVKDCVNYYFTANHPDSFFLEDDDRRFFVHEVTVGARPEAEYKAYERWLDEEGGSAIVFDYLLSLEMGSFHPTSPAYKTKARSRMIATVQSDLATWVRQAVENPDHTLRLGEIAITRDLFTTKELLGFYDPSSNTSTKANGMGRELRKAGIRLVCDGHQVSLKDGSRDRYYIIRNQERWLKATLHDVQKYLNVEAAGARKKSS
jgi:hypothetical protein